MERRNLSRIYIFDIYPGEKREPTVFEDCQEETQDKWLDSLDIKTLKNLAKMLGQSLRRIGDEFNLMVN